MKTPFLAALAVTATVATASAVHAASLGVPDEATIAKIEAQLHMPRGAAPLVRYDRYYAYREESGRLLILGYFTPAEAPGHVGEVHRLPDDRQMPFVADGGCSYVQVWWDVKAAKLLGASCNGVA